MAAATAVCRSQAQSAAALEKAPGKDKLAALGELTPRPAETAAKPEAPVSEEAPAPKASRPIDIPIPVGHDAKGVKLPYYDLKSGKLNMHFSIGRAFRADAGHLDLSDLKIETFDDSGKPDMGIEMRVSVLDMDTHIITSSQPVIVRRSDFIITGSNIIFNGQTRKATMAGDVRTTLYSSDKPDSKQDEKDKTSKGIAQ